MVGYFLVLGYSRCLLGLPKKRGIRNLCSYCGFMSWQKEIEYILDL